MKLYRFKVVTSNMDYIEVEANDPEKARDLAMDKGMVLHPRSKDNSGPQGSTTERFLNGGDFMEKDSNGNL